MPFSLYTESVVATSNTSRAAPGLDRDLDPQPMEIGTGQGRLRRDACYVANWRHVYQQKDGRRDGHQKFQQDLILAEQAPRGTQRRDQPSQQ